MQLNYAQELTPTRIWNIKQNKPSLIVHDLESLVDADIVYSVLLGRGVFKWLAVRRDLIKLKDIWKTRITATIERIHEAKRTHIAYDLGYARGYLKAYEECRSEVRGLCHSARFRCPDFDKQAQQWLDAMEKTQEDTKNEAEF